jgi:hypothetical protein
MAGPPYLTDDPETVEPSHWEIYLASQTVRSHEGWVASAPHVEVNYGLVTDVQLHVIAPLVLSAPKAEPVRYGYGNTELGVKLRFVHETAWMPQIGTFPLFLAPTGSRDVGSSKAQVLLPLWLQKSSGAWQAYGGGGYWLRKGEENRNGWFFGFHVQRTLGAVALGAEIFHLTPSVVDGVSETGFDVGAVIDFSRLHHLLFSAGAIFVGPFGLQSYLAYQLTFAM